MTTAIASLPPATAPVWVDSEDAEPGSEVPSIKFSELSANKKEFSFYDFLDIINPLHHIPVISTIYRDLTGDEIGLAARIIGGGLFGGPFGLFNAALTAAVEETTGKEPGGHFLAALQELVSPTASTATAAAAQSAALPGETKPAAATAEPDADPAPVPDAPTAAVLPAPSRSPISRRQLQFMRPAPFAPAPEIPGALAARNLPAAPGAATQISRAQDEARGDSTVSGADAERARIANKIFAAQKAQINLLLASVTANRSLQTDAARADNREDRNKAEPPADPFRQHPNSIPAGASSEWVSTAMGQALDKYQQTLRLRGTGVALPVPGR